MLWYICNQQQISGQVLDGSWQLSSNIDPENQPSQDRQVDISWRKGNPKI